MLGKTLFLVYLVQGKNFRFRAYVVVSCVEMFFVPRELLLFDNGSQRTVEGKGLPFSQTDDSCLNFCMQIQF